MDFVNGELRGLAGPAVNASDGKTADGKFLMKAYGNESGNETVHMALRYYCQTLNHIFTLEDDISLDSDVTTGIDEDYIPLFTLGAEKYPVMKVVDVDSIITKVGLTPALDGEVGAFVGDECRGAAPISPFGGTMLLIYGCRAGESIALQYYDANLKILFTIPNAVVM